MIELLSGHLYSSPRVYIRELLQNGTDAIRARAKTDTDFSGQISLEVIASADGPRTLIFEDNGVGLTEDEVHQFLAIIGESSKRAEEMRNTDFIGRFGIGLLSCFVVSDEIVVITRSIHSETAVEWRGRPDGTYTIRQLEGNFTPGTRIYLRSKLGFEEYFDIATVRDLCRHYGGLLPYPVSVSDGIRTQTINESKPLWLLPNWQQTVSHEAMLDYGRRFFGESFIDYIPLRSETGDVTGIAFVLPHRAAITTKTNHQVYLKQMLLSENVDNILPNWAFFVKCIINTNDLLPTASREEFYEDSKLSVVRETLGNCLRDYLIYLAEHDLPRLHKLIAIHFLSIKALAVQDDQLYRLFIKWLPFETSQGRLTMEQILERNKLIRYTPSLDEYRQISRVSAAQSMCVINGGYVFDAELIERLPDFFPEYSVERVDPLDITESLEDLTIPEQQLAFQFMRTANTVLQSFGCNAEIKKFLPLELPALYSTSEEATFLRSVERTQEESNPLFASILESLNAAFGAPAAHGQLCFNFNNPVILKLVQSADPKLQQMAIEMIYVQALLMGHHPLNHREMKLLNNGLFNLIELGMR
ncbi:HSP90 family protein [Tumebacillus algifaecis]|uniref:HSP90 family protein n=2 Tax=Tumebacillus algifaecis TaxID=1214604 RepID=A0A223D6U1_9BACL|nr:HSP90 family protein [Tumebacillus algifaecis]